MCSSDEDESPLPASDATLDQSPLETPHASQNVTVVKLIGERRLYINGFVYVRNHIDSRSNKVHWECRRYRKQKCHGRAITSNSKLSESIILYRGLEESPHSHKPSLREVQEAEEAAKTEQSGKRKLQTDNRSRSAEVELHVSKSTKTGVKMDADKSTTKLNSKQRASSSTRQLSRNLDPATPRLIGNKLYIDGFLYYKNASYISDGHLSKIRWVCKRYETQKCLATVITSDPFKGQALTVYSGSGESEHSHSRCLVDVEEAEREVESISRKNQPATNVTNQDVAETISSDTQSPTVHQSENLDAEKDIEPESSTQVQSVLDNGVSGPDDDLNSEHSRNRISVKLIGKRLCVNGFVYTKHSNGPELIWVCRRYRKTGCSAKVSTSNPSLGEELAVLKGDELPRHNHLPCELEVEEAELLAKLDLNRSKLEDSQVAEAQNGSNIGLIQNSPASHKHLNRKEMKPTVSTKVQPQQRAKEESSALPSRISRSPESQRLIGRRLCIDGYIYVKSSVGSNRTMWECKRYRSSRCPGRASTSNTTSSKELVVYRGPEISKHDHSPSTAEVEEAEELASAQKKLKKPKLERGSAKVKSKVSLSKKDQHLTSSQFQRSKLLRASNTKGDVLKKNPKTKKNGLLQDHQVYRKFLVKFLKKPVFDRRSVIEALKIIYSSKQGCLMAYATVLENRKKIERDLEALKNNPKATIAALNSDSFTTLQDESAEMDIDVKQVSEHDSSAPDSKNSTDAVLNERASRTACGQEAEQVVTDNCAQKIGATVPVQSCKSQEPPLLSQEKNADPIPPLPAALALKDLSSSEQPSPNLSQDESEKRREIICIDLTDDPDEPPRVKQELSETSAEASLQLDKTKEVMVSSNSLMSPCAQNFESDLTQSVGVIPYSNYLREVSSFGPLQQNYHPNQFAMHPNFTNAYYNPTIYNSLDYGRENSNFSTSYTVNNLQVPVMINVPSMRNNANPELLHSQLQVLHQPNMKK